MALSWKISGEAGFGITTIGLTFAKFVARHGLSVWSYAEYPSLIRGGFTTFEATISKDPYRTLKDNLDFHICLRQDGFDRDKHRISEHSIVLYDKDTVKITESSPKKGIFIPVPYKDIKAKYKAPQVMVNTVSIGATIALFGWSIDSFCEMLADEFSKKGTDVITFNQTLARSGYDFIKAYMFDRADNYKSDIHSVLVENIPFLDRSAYEGKSNSKYMVMTGNDVFSLGSMLAGVKAYCAYPMSPASTVLSTLASWSTKEQIVVRHTEDEVAAINEAVGFAYAGARSSVGTSGGGFALMVEGLSYAGIAEIPIVTYLVQRPGPATGLPTWTGQGDLLFAVHAGHGEFMKIVISPGDNEEMLELSSQAYDMADVFQTPVIVVSDKLLGESLSTISKKWYDEYASNYSPNRGKIKSSATNPYLRYADSADGVSDYLIPGVQKGVFWQANSYEHSEDSHTTEDALVTTKQVEKRMRKISTYLSSKYYKLPKIFGDHTNSQVTFVSYGSNKHALISAIETLAARGVIASYIHFTHLFPLDVSKVKDILNKARRLVFVENGAIGQLPKLLQQEACLETTYETILKYDGRPILQSEVVNFIITNDKLQV